MNNQIVVATPYEGEVRYFKTIRNCVFGLGLSVSEQAVNQSIQRKGYWDNTDWYIVKRELG